MKKISAFLLLFLFVNFAFADGYITGNISGGCLNYGDLNAVFELNQHTCLSGYYLPANYDGCVACPSDAICNGGTFTFNETMAQGIVYTTITQNISHGCAINIIPSGAIFEINQHTCTPGYYLPANTDGCVGCPENSYCAGGTYTFNETTAQGIVACAAGLFAPTGMWEVAQCGRILHVGDEVVYLRATKKTLHAVHVDVNNDGIADFFGNMTTADVPMHAGTTRKLKVQFGGQTYSVYDDTVTVPE